jgi:hypothetical protein
MGFRGGPESNGKLLIQLHSTFLRVFPQKEFEELRALKITQS